MKNFKIIFSAIILLLNMCFSNSFANAKTSIINDLSGLTATQFENIGYLIKTDLRNEPIKKYKIKNIRNNNSILTLPNIKTKIANENIFYEKNTDNIKVNIIENTSESNKSYNTKINFQTNDDSKIKIEYLTSNTKQNKQTTVKNFSLKKIFFTIIGIILLSALGISAIFISKKILKSKEFSNKSKKQKKKDNNPFSVNKKINKLRKLPSKNLSEEQKKNKIKKYKKINKQNPYRELYLLDKDINKIIGDLVKIIVPKDDLILMPGVPELPGIDKIKKEQTQDIINSIPTFSVEKTDEDIVKEAKLIEEVEDIIFTEKNAFFDNIFPIQEIPEKAEKHEESSYAEIIEKIDEKIKEETTTPNEDEEPELLDTYPLGENRAFSLVKYGNKVSLIGNIDLKIFVLKVFNDTDKIEAASLLTEFCTHSQFYDTYAITVNKFKALVNVYKDSIMLIGEY